MIRALLALFASVACAIPAPPAPAAEPGDDKKKVYRVYLVLWNGETDVEKGLRNYAAKRRLPFRFIVKDLARDSSKLGGLVAEIRQVKPDLVYTWGTQITLAVVGENSTVGTDLYVSKTPVVFSMVAFPTGSQIVPNLESSLRNVTGVMSSVPLESQIKAMRAYRPMRRLGVIYNGLESNAVFNIRELKKLSTEMNFEVIDRRIPLNDQGHPDETAIPKVISEIAAAEPQFLYLGQDNFVTQHRKTIVREGLRYGMPSFGNGEVQARDSDTLVSLYADHAGIGQLVGYMMEHILVHGVRPQDVPIQRLGRYTYTVRLSIARRLKLFPPISVLDYAEIIDGTKN